MEDARQDSLIMEVATHSNFVMNVYGMCGTTQLTEYGDRGNLHDYVKIARQANRDLMKSVDKLKISIHIASAVADLHDNAVAVVHGDICCHQFLWMDGFYKLNDFHMSSFLQINAATNQFCKGRNHVSSAVSVRNKWTGIVTSSCLSVAVMHLFPQEYLWRAPEESEKESELIDLKKVDVWMMAQTMFYVYTKNWLYEGIPEKKALSMFHNQRLSAFPSHLDTKVPANAAMQSAISQCWAHDPEDRPSARQIRDFLLQELSTILGRNVGPHDTDILRVEIPPLPKNHRFTGSSMDAASETKKAQRHIHYASE
jgi:serine/threonine protein kinase